MTISDFRTQFYKILKRTSATFTDTLADFCINAGIKELANIYTWPEMLSEETLTIVGTGVGATALYTYPTRMKELYGIVIVDTSNTYPLGFEHDMNRANTYNYRTVINKGRPVMFTDLGTQLELTPFPDQNYTGYMKVSRYPATISDTNTTPLFTDKDELILASALIYGYAMIRDTDPNANSQMKVWTDIQKKLLVPYLSVVKNRAWLPILAKNSGSNNASTGDWWNNPFVHSMKEVG